MTSTFLISETKLRQFSDINNNTDTELLRNAVREAQDIELQRILGTLLYESLLAQVDAGPVWTTPAYETLVNGYVQNALLYWSYYYALEDIMIRPRNNGVLIPTGGENSIEADKYYYNTKRQSGQNKAEYYSEKLSNYLISNTNLFPETQQTTELYEELPDYSVQYGSPFVFANSGYAPHLRGAIDAGLQLSDSRFPYLPPPTTNTKRIK